MVGTVLCAGQCVCCSDAPLGSWRTCPSCWECWWPLGGLPELQRVIMPKVRPSCGDPCPAIDPYGVIKAQPSQPNWGQFRRVILALHLSLWVWLSLGCITVPRSLHPFPALPFHRCRPQEPSSIKLLRSRLHCGDASHAARPATFCPVFT